MEINKKVFWANTKALREDKGWTQPEISEKLGINYRSYNNLERGFASKLPIELAKKIADLFETTIEELSQGEEPEEPLVDPEIINFWKNVKSRRLKLGLSQEDMAKKLAMSAQNFQTKEAGKAAKLPSHLVKQVAEALGCTVDELKGEKDGRVNVIAIPAPDVVQERVMNTVIDRPMSNNSPSYDISHLPESVQRFISDISNASLITNLVVDYLMNKNK